MRKIAERNHVSDYIVRRELEEETSTITHYIKNLPRVISFDEFKADTTEGKYTFILNDQYIRKYWIFCQIEKKRVSRTVFYTYRK